MTSPGPRTSWRRSRSPACRRCCSWGAPDDERLARFRDYRGLGLAGTARSRSAEWMSRELPPVFEWLRGLGAPVTQYKICSTFDSSPRVGSIGRAIDLAQEAFGADYVPLVVGAPVLRRYQVFGNLFATVGGVTHRLDRHPTMSRHPVTPMDEADLGRHLARQTRRPIGVLDILALRGEQPEAALAELLEAQHPEIVLFDVLDEASLETVGRLVWAERPGAQTFVVASSGLQYALVAHWRATGQLEAPASPAGPGAVERLVVVSGSCAPATAEQIRWACDNGYAGCALDPRALVESPERVEQVVQWASDTLAGGRSPVLYTALGPDDAAIVDAGAGGDDFNAALGDRLGHILRQVLHASGVRRAVVCGGDTSGHVGEQLGLYALTAWTPIAPGSPLCRGHADDPDLDGLAIALKGGQVGRPEYFEQVRQGVA
ncbi:MAG: four-carbon acid sugar kinase family protein [Halofilum sp. (in: g-proteobacteria)]|nr:four-carbon acid sugar kinase family protein [Halofilum sp. (in: g-proteobacteria)]